MVQSEIEPVHGHAVVTARKAAAAPVVPKAMHCGTLVQEVPQKARVFVWLGVLALGSTVGSRPGAVWVSRLAAMLLPGVGDVPGVGAAAGAAVAAVLSAPFLPGSNLRVPHMKLLSSAQAYYYCWRGGQPVECSTTGYAAVLLQKKPR